MRVADRTCAADAPHVERGLCPYCEKPPAKLVDTYCSAHRNYSTEKILFRLKDAAEMPDAEKLAGEHPSTEYTAFKTQPTMLEFQDPRVNKGLGLERYCLQNSIPLDEVIAFGDMSNDNGMMTTAGWSVCLKNGADDTKALADAITEYDNDHDGLGHYMIDHWYRPQGWKIPEGIE
jgi:hydroxymethylpyrimidine pyrophosphatase-like HAD family hydrolase